MNYLIAGQDEQGRVLLLTTKDFPTVGSANEYVATVHPMLKPAVYMRADASQSEPITPHVGTGRIFRGYIYSELEMSKAERGSDAWLAAGSESTPATIGSTSQLVRGLNNMLAEFAAIANHCRTGGKWTQTIDNRYAAILANARAKGLDWAARLP